MQKYKSWLKKENELVEANLASNGWYCITCSDKVLGELLARKRSDAKFGLNNYVFQHTNTICNFWYMAKPKGKSEVKEQSNK